MLQVTKQPLGSERESEGVESPPLATTIALILRRQYPIIAFLFLISIGVGLLYLLTTPPTFTGQAMLVIDSRKVQVFQQQSVLGDYSVDSTTVETQVEILKSEGIGLAVIKDLHLAHDPEFTSSGGGLLGQIFELVSRTFGSEDSATEFEQTRRALASLERRLSVRRVGLSYAIQISFQSLSPDRAAQVANAIADAYINDQLEAKYQATRRASTWLQQRIQELRTQASAAERAVVDFKAKNDIVDTGGKLMNEQQLTEVNSQLILAHAATAESKARLDRIQEIMLQEIPDASVADALKNEVIVRLRNQYLDLAAREANWATRYGSTHLAAVNLRNQMKELRRSIANELGRIAESYKSDYEIAQTREQSLRESLAGVVSQSKVTSQAQLGLRELESNAQTYRALHDNFLQRYMEAVQQQSFPITEARLISPATRPLKKSAPLGSVVLSLSALGGLALSFGIAMFREWTDNVFRTSNQVESILQNTCITMLPAIKTVGGDAGGSGASKAVAPPGGRVLDYQGAPLLRYVVEQPFSRFAESIRSIKVAADLNSVSRANRILGFTSAIPNEGKSTISANLAELIAHAGMKVMLIDADLRNPSLSRRLAPQAKAGLLDVLAGRAAVEAVTYFDPATKLHFLPTGVTSRLLHTNELIASDEMRRLIEEMRERFDYVVVDLPPLTPVVDVRASTHFIDSYVFVIEWGRTRIDAVRTALGTAGGISDRLLGFVLNKADVNRVNRYKGYHGGYYYKRYYARYGYVE
jgi:succinoglycan biosynthesis transport protein ExoP